MKAQIYFIIKSTALIFLLYLKAVVSERCSVGSPLFPIPPPEFPDFMDAFKVTLSRIGIESLWSNDRDAHPLTSCPNSVNWSEFNSRLCLGDPMVLEVYCKTVSTTSDPPTLMSDSGTSIYVESRAPELPNTISPEISITISPDQTTDDASSFILKDDHQSVGITNSTEISSVTSSSFTDFPVPFTGLSDSAKPVPPDLFSRPSPANTSTVEALYQAEGSQVAIGVSCGLTLLVILIIVCIIAFSQDRACDARRVMIPMFKVLQRQRSDVQPISTSELSQPSTPLQEFPPRLMSTNNNVAEVRRSDDEKQRSSLKVTSSDEVRYDLQSNDFPIEMRNGKDIAIDVFSSCNKALDQRFENDYIKVNHDKT